MTRKEMLLEFLQESPSDPFILFALGKEYENDKEFEKSIAIYEQLMIQHPTYTGCYYHFGKLLVFLQRPEEAKLIYQTGIEISEKAKDAHSKSELQSALLELSIEDIEN